MVATSDAWVGVFQNGINGTEAPTDVIGSFGVTFSSMVFESTGLAIQPASGSFQIFGIPSGHTGATGTLLLTIPAGGAGGNPSDFAGSSGGPFTHLRFRNNATANSCQLGTLCWT